MPVTRVGARRERGHDGERRGRVGQVGEVDVDAPQPTGAADLGASPRRCSTSAPIRPRTSTKREVALAAARRPSPGTRTRPPEMAAAAKKYDAADGVGLDPVARRLGSGRRRPRSCCRPGDVDRRRRTSAIAAMVSVDVGPRHQRGGERRRVRPSAIAGPASSSPDRNWLDTSPAARRDRRASPPVAATSTGRWPAASARRHVGAERRGGRRWSGPSAGPSSCGCRVEAVVGPCPSASSGSRKRAVVPDMRASSVTAPARKRPPRAVDDAAARSPSRPRSATPSAPRQRPSPRCRRPGARRRASSGPSASAAHTRARLVMLFDPGSRDRRRRAGGRGARSAPARSWHGYAGRSSRRPRAPWR